MAMTDTEIRKAQSGDKAYRVSDGSGLYLWITPTGGKLWRWKYRHEKEEKLMSFGKYPEMPLALARERHEDARNLFAQGIDPMAERKAAKTAEKAAAESSFRTIASLWFDHQQVNKSRLHVDATRLRMRAKIFPLLGARFTGKVDEPELVAKITLLLHLKLLILAPNTTASA